MNCIRCGAPRVNNANFCFNCATPFTPPQFQQQQFQGSMPIQQNPFLVNEPAPELFNAQKALFTVGIIAFSVNAFWVLIRLMDRFLGIEIFYRYGFITNGLSFVTSIMTLFFCFILVKKPNHKSVLLVFFILLTLMEIYSIFFMYGPRY